ncbi:MAG TPA: M4 family metallopeptidase, partial [Segetibacter sp.]
ATATTLYNGNQTIVTDWRGFPTYNHRLYDCNRNIHTKYGYGFNPEATNGGTWWGTNNQSATSGHWAAEMTWDLYRNVYGRNGCNNGGRQIKLLVDDPSANGGASYVYDNNNNDKILIGRTIQGDRSLSTLDVVGHEITHGLTKATADLIYENQSGALNESFSDIFGFMVERRAQGGVFDWRLGEDAFVETGGIRDMENPNLYGDPAQFEGLFWATGTGDNGGVHTNSGVQNRWFFLLSNGNLVNGGNVTGIGIDNAALIAWRTLLFYLGQNSNYNDARNGSINAAIGWFGECSNEVMQVRNAWAAVGVGAVANPNCITLDATSINVCYDDPFSPPPFPITITAAFRPANGTITWNVPPDFNFTISGDQLTLHSGPMDPDVFLPISATLTSGVGNPVTATAWYSTYSCSGRLMMSNTTGVETIIKDVPKGISIFPNPADEFINVELTTKAKVKLLDLNGRVVLEQQCNTGLNRINTRKFSKGMYVLLIVGNGKSTTSKIQINH